MFWFSANENAEFHLGPNLLPIYFLTFNFSTTCIFIPYKGERKRVSSKQFQFYTYMYTINSGVTGVKHQRKCSFHLRFHQVQKRCKYVFVEKSPTILKFNSNFFFWEKLNEDIQCMHKGN